MARFTLYAVGLCLSPCQTESRVGARDTTSDDPGDTCWTQNIIGMPRIQKHILFLLLHVFGDKKTQVTAACIYTDMILVCDTC